MATVIVEDRAEIKPTPAENLEAGEVGPPELVDGSDLVFELIGRLYHDEGKTGEKIMCFQGPICRSLWYQVTFLLCERHGQFSWR